MRGTLIEAWSETGCGRKHPCHSHANSPHSCRGTARNPCRPRFQHGPGRCDPQFDNPTACRLAGALATL